MKRYTLGVAISDKQIVLIRKTKPVWQKGSYNFVGGKIEPGEESVDCMVREFWEETSVSTVKEDWKYLGKMYRTDDFEMFVYLFEGDISGARTKTEEEVEIWDRDAFLVEFESNPKYFMSNLAMMYQFAVSRDYKEYGCTFEIQFPPSDQGHHD